VIREVRVLTRYASLRARSSPLRHLRLVGVAALVLPCAGFVRNGLVVLLAFSQLVLFAILLRVGDGGTVNNQASH
jgi:hypothetical protein